MRQQKLSITPNTSLHVTLGQLIISAVIVRSSELELVVGRIGFPNIERTMRVGGAVLFETPDDGLVEVRVIGIDYAVVGSMTGGRLVNEATLLISEVSPRRGIAAGFAPQDVGNTPFEVHEIHRIRASLGEVREAARKHAELTPEQFDFISRKLDEVAESAGRLGRKDWMNLAIGTLTNIVVAAAINSEVARFLFRTAGGALSWLFGETLKILP